MAKMSAADERKLVFQWIGVEEGHLIDFTHGDVTTFFVADCEVDIDPQIYKGTKAVRFQGILKDLDGPDQAVVIRRLLQRCPVGSVERRTHALAEHFLRLATQLEGALPVANPALVLPNQIVEDALRDAELLMQEHGPERATDRVHTALHAYFRWLCADHQIASNDDASITALYSLLRQHHTAFQPTGPRANDITKVLRSLSAVIDALCPIRNHASAAHPAVVLGAPEAWLVINAVRTLFHYFEARR